jgi:Undecaprenyl-phosphate glucose phosphotransferase
VPRDGLSGGTSEVQTGGGRMSDAAMIMDLSSLALKVVECAVIIGCGMLLLAVFGDDFPKSMVHDHYRVTAFGTLLYLTLATAVGTYDVETLFVGRHRLTLIARTWGVTAIFLVTLGFILKASAQISREWGVAWFFSSAAALWLAKALFSTLLNRTKRQGVFDVRTAVFGGGEQADKLIAYLTSRPDLMVRLVARYDDRGDAREHALPRMGGLTALLSSIRRGEVDQVIVALPWSSEERVRSVVQQLALTPVRIRLSPDLVGFAYLDKPQALLGGLPVLTLFDRPISGLDQGIKWIEDEVLASLLVVLLSPLLAAIAIAIKLDSRGPILFTQLREGFNDRKFRVFKFRTMHVDDCDGAEIRQAMEADPRVTRVGGFLRRTSLDELPQLFNVISGDMSLVGPRPHAPSTKAGQRLFREVVSTYAARHRVKPGLTGWAQVNGWRGPTDTDDKLVKRLEHDLHYIDNWSVTLDLRILLRTLLVPLRGNNAF